MRLKTLTTSLVLVIACVILPLSVHAQTVTSTSATSLINAQITQLKTILSKLGSTLSPIITPLLTISSSTPKVPTGINTPSVPITTRAPFTTTLQLGSTNGQVSILQQYLAEYPSLYPGVKVTGTFDVATQQAIKIFQQQQDITSSGILDTTTRSVLNTLYVNQEMNARSVQISSTKTTTNSASNLLSIPSTNVSAQYALLVKSSVSLASAANIIKTAGGTGLVQYIYLHAIQATLTGYEAERLSANADFVQVTPAQAAEPRMASGGGAVRVAIVDDFSTPTSHGNEVLAAYEQACNGTCADPNPILVQADMNSLLSMDDGIIQAINEGATVINLSGGCDISDCSLTDAELNMLSDLQANGAVLVVASGNQPNFVDSFSQAGALSNNVVEVSGLDPNDSNEMDGQTTQVADVFADDDAPPGTWDSSWGTSFAAPRVADLIANALVASDGTSYAAAFSDPSVRTASFFGETDQQADDGTISNDTSNMDDTTNDGDQNGSDDTTGSSNGTYFTTTPSDQSDNTNTTQVESSDGGDSASDDTNDSETTMGGGLVSPGPTTDAGGVVGPESGAAGASGGTWMCDSTGYCEQAAAIIPIQAQITHVETEIENFFGALFGSSH